MTGPTVSPSLGGVILGGGYASRMGRCKLLLPLEERTALEHAVHTMRQSGIEHIIVVSGHYEKEMRSSVEALGAISVHNPRYDEGMFSSVQAGLAALPPSVEACFLLPGDIPLVKESTYRKLLEGRKPETSLIIPAFRGKTGHPPLFEASLVPSILNWKGEEGLRGAFQAFAPEPLLVPVTDQAILLDMDTPEDYEQLQVYAERRGLPTEEECLALWDLAETPENVRLHCRTVQAGVVILAMELLGKGYSLNVERLATAALLHDISKGQASHAKRGAAFLEDHGYASLAPLVAHHMDLPEKLSPQTALEEEILYCVDKLVEDTSYMPLEKRREMKKACFKGRPEALKAMERKMQRAEKIQNALEEKIGKSLESILGGIHPWA